MSRQLKRVVSLLLTAIMVFGAVPIGCYVGVDLPDFLAADTIVANAADSTTKGIENRLNVIKSVYPSGSYFTVSGNLYASDSGSDCKLSLIPARGGLSTGAKAASVCWDGYSCCAFARYVFYNIFYHDAETSSYSTKVSIDNAKPGDFVVFNNNSHYGIFLKADADNIYVYDSNYTSTPTNRVSWLTKISRSKVSHIWHSNSYSEYNDKYIDNDYILEVYFNVNGGSISSDTYKLSSGLIYNKSDSTKYYQKWTYDNTKENGLVNYSTFGIYKTGFKFVGWGTKPSGGTVFSQSDSTLKPSDIKPDIVNGNCSVILYAQWESVGNYVDVWVSTKGKDYQYNECPEVSQGIVQNSYYFWFKIANSETHELYNTYADSNYKSIISVYNPDGTLLYSGEYSKSDNNWIKATPTQAGQYKVNIKLTGEVTANYSEYFTVKSDGKVTLTPSTLTLDLKSSPSKTVEIALSGNWPDGATYSIKTSNNNISQTNSGRTITVTAKKKGTSNLYVDILDKSGTVIASATANVMVTAPEYTVAYNANGGSGAPSSQVKIYATALTLSSSKPTRNGYIFVNWNTKADGTGKSYAAGASYTSNAAVTLYAQWKVNTYSIAFNSNGASGSMSNLSMTYGTAKNLTANAFTKTGYTFTGWNTKADGSGTMYADKASVKNLTSSNGATVTLYAIWKKNSVDTYTLSYNANGGSGAPSSQSGSTSYIISSIKPTRSGYIFLGWSENSTAIIGSYISGDTITIATNTTLYAVWLRRPVITRIEVQVRTPSTTTISYGDSIILHADMNEALPSGWKIKWTADNGNFSYSASADGSTCTISPSKSGDTTFTATVYDENGNVVSEDTQVMKSKAGFFDKLVAFFKKLFGMTKVISQSINF